MKVNYKTHPILQKIADGKLGVTPVFASDQAFITEGYVNILSESFKRNVSAFRNITYVSKEYYDAAELAAPKLSGLYKDIILNNIDDIIIQGTFMVGSRVFCIKSHIKKDSEFHHSVFFAFHLSGMPIVFYETGMDGREGTFIWVSNCESDAVRKKGIEAVAHMAIADVSLIHLFKSYASVETKFVEAKSKIMKGLKKYQNDTSLDITYLTSKWFTNIVRSEGFAVRGHFRLQPKKINGEWTKELIWIKDFEKHGYTHRAQILGNAI